LSLNFKKSWTSCLVLNFGDSKFTTYGDDACGDDACGNGVCGDGACGDDVLADNVVDDVLADGVEEGVLDGDCGCAALNLSSSILNLLDNKSISNPSVPPT